MYATRVVPFDPVGPVFPIAQYYVAGILGGHHVRLTAWRFPLLASRIIVPMLTDKLKYLQ